MTTEANQRYITTYQSSYVDFPSFFVDKSHSYEDQRLRSTLLANGTVYSIDSLFNLILYLFTRLSSSFLISVGQASVSNNSSPDEKGERRSRAHTYPNHTPSPDSHQSFLERDRRRRVRSGANTMTSYPTTSSMMDKKNEFKSPQADAELDLSTSILNQLNKLESLSKKYSTLKQKHKKIDGVSEAKITKFVRPKVASYPGRGGRYTSSSIYTSASVNSS